MNTKELSKEQILKDIQAWGAQKPIVTGHSGTPEKSDTLTAEDIQAWAKARENGNC